MASKTPEEPSTTVSSENSEDSLDEENILKRVGSLPLVSSVCDMVSANYACMKRKNSYLQTVCTGAEKGVSTLTGVAVSKVQPILTSFEPQLATANKYACRGLDTMEEKLPILQQTADQVVLDTKEMVSSKVAGAKNAVTHRLSGLIYMAKDAVHGSVKTTTSLVSTTMSTLMGPRVSRMAKDGMAAALGRSHAFMDRYLLVTDDNIIELRPWCEPTPGHQELLQREWEDFLACWISLLSKFHRYVSNKSQHHIGQASQRIKRTLQNQYLEWKAWLVALYYTVTLPLRTVYLIILFTIEELTNRFQENVPQVSYVLAELHMALSTLNCLQDLCQRIFIRVWEKISEEEHMNALLDYIAQIIPFCFLTYHCKCRGTFSSRTLKALQKMQTSNEDIGGVKEPENIIVVVKKPI